MFSSFCPISALVLGVKRGGINWVDSLMFAGTERPWTVPDFWYSTQADPSAIRIQSATLLSSLLPPPPRRTRDVSSHNRLDGQDLRPPNPDRPSDELVLVLMYLLRHLVEVASDDMVRDVLGLGRVGKKVEKEEGERCQQLALVRDTLSLSFTSASLFFAWDRVELTFCIVTSNAEMRSVATKSSASGWPGTS